MDPDAEIVEPTLTGNCSLLIGYLAGSLRPDGVYRLVEFDPEGGGAILQHVRNKNRYRVSARQISGAA